jgi:hypothetical protein
MYLTRNQAYEQSYRGFESHPFRHRINDLGNVLVEVVFSSLIGFDVRFDAAKAGESGHSLLVHPVGNGRPERPPHNLLAVGLGTLLAALLCRVINGYKLRKWICWWNS